MRRPRLASLKNELALLFFAVTAVALAVIYFFVVPQLQSDLEEQQLRDISRSASASSGALERVMGTDVEAGTLDRLVRAVADGAGTQVTLLGVQRSSGRGGPLYVISDSREQSDVPADYGLAADALRSRRPQRRTARLGGEFVGEAAQPLLYRGSVEWVAVHSRSLDDVAETVGVVRTRVIVAGAAALLLALAGGYLIARALARRVRRLESAARHVAAGRFIEPLPVDSRDELGQLTHTFNEMQAQLSRVDRARKDFIANASHELRTPIFSLAGFVELLEDEELDEPTRAEFLSTMREQVERLQKLAVDLLDLSRLDAGSLQVEEEQVDLADVARGVAREFGAALTQHGTDLELSLPEEGPEARGDRERVAQIMRILLDNALRHTPEGTSVTLSANRENGAAEFTVADAGPGLDQSAAGRVFERFFTADMAGGSGLGLAIAKELAERMRGEITLTCRPGQTTFTLTLPAAGLDGQA